MLHTCVAPFRKSTATVAFVVAAATVGLSMGGPAAVAAVNGAGEAPVTSGGLVSRTPTQGAATQDDPAAAPASPPPGAPPTAPVVVPDAGRPPIRLEPVRVDFGFLPPKTVGNAEFTLTNTSHEPLTILEVSPSCRCTTVGDHVGKIIEPGESYLLEVKLDAAIIPQSRSAVVRVLFDGYQRTIDLSVRAEVANPIRTVPGYINAPDGTRPSGRLVVESIDERPFLICSVHGLPVRYVDFDATTDEPRTRYVIEYDLEELPPGRMPGWLIIETDHPIFPVVDVRIRGDMSDFRVGIRGLRDVRVPMGLIAPDGAGETTVEFGKLRVLIEFTEVESLTDDATAELLGQEGDTERLLVRIRLRPKEGHRGLLYAPVRLKTAQASQEVVLFATVGDGPCISPSPSKSTE